MIDPGIPDLLYSLGAPAAASIITAATILYFQQRPRNGNGKNGNGATQKEIDQAKEIATLKQQVLALEELPNLHNQLLEKVTTIGTILGESVKPQLDAIVVRLAALERRQT